MGINEYLNEIYLSNKASYGFPFHLSFLRGSVSHTNYDNLINTIKSTSKFSSILLQVHIL